MDTFNSRIRHSDRVAYTIGAAILAVSIALATLASGCHTMDPYRPGSHPVAAGPAATPDGRPDLPGRPTAPGDALWDLEQALKRHFPSPHPVVVRLSPLQDPYLGVTYPDGRGGPLGDRPLPTSPYAGPPELEPLVIEVRDDLVGWQQRDVLIHEYAHVLAWGAPESPHGPVWASYFGLIYKATRGEQ